MRGWLQECGDCSQIGAEPLSREPCSAAPESTSTGPRPAPEEGGGKRNWRPWLHQAHGRGWTVPRGCCWGFKWALSNLLPAPGASLPSCSSCLPPRTEEPQEGKCFILRAKLLGRGHRAGQSHWPPAWLRQLSLPRPWQGTQPACRKGHPAHACSVLSYGKAWCYAE